MVLNIIRYFYYILFIVTPLLVYSHTSELFEFNKMMFIYFCTAVITCGWLFLQIQNKKLTIKLHWLYIPLALFFGALVLSTIFSIDMHTSIFGYYGRFNGGLFSIICYTLLFFIFIQVSDKEHMTRSLEYAFYTAVVTVLWGLPGRVGYDLSCLVFTGRLTNACWSDQFQPAVRMFSTLGQPNWLGAYLVAAFFIGIGLLAYKKKTSFKLPVWIPYSIAFVLLFMGILATRSRSAMLALAIGLGVTGLFYVLKRRSIILENWKRIAGVGVVMLIILVMFKTGINQVDRFISFSNKPEQQTVTQAPTEPASPSAPSGVTESFDIRKIVWEGAVELGKRYPVFGSGVETFAYAYYFTRPEAHNYTSEWDFLYNKAHNEFLNYFATTGYVGTITYLLMIGSFIAYCTYFILKKKKTNEQYLLVGLLSMYISILVTNFFGFSISVIQLFFYILPAAAILAVSDDLPEKNISLQWDGLITKSAKGIILVFFSMWTIYLVRYYFADISYARADLLQRSGEYQQAFSEFEMALSLRYEHVYEDKLSSTLANLAFLTSFQDDKQLSRELVKASNALNEHSLQESPMNVLYWKTKAKNYYLFYQISLDKNNLDVAIKSMQQAEKLAPTDPKIPYTTALFYSLAAEEEKTPEKIAEYESASLQQIDNAIALKKNYTDAIELKKTLQDKQAQ